MNQAQHLLTKMVDAELASALDNRTVQLGAIFFLLEHDGCILKRSSAMNIEYLAKAKTDLKAVADGSGIDWVTPDKLTIPVNLFDADGNKVFASQIMMNIKESK